MTCAAAPTLAVAIGGSMAQVLVAGSNTAALVVAPFFAIDFIFLAANALKIPSGGWLPLLCTMNCTVATELLRAPLGVAVADIDACIAPVAPGADGLLLLPFFNGERTPDLPRAKGCLLGLDARNTSTGHLLRAAVEGATFALRFGIDELKGLGLGAAEIVLTGGGAGSRVRVAVTYDAPTDVPVVGAFVGPVRTTRTVTIRVEG